MVPVGEKTSDQAKDQAYNQGQIQPVTEGSLPENSKRPFEGEEEEEKEEKFSPDSKKLKIGENTSNETQIETKETIKKCGYFLKNRGRNCGVQVRSDLKYCFDHMRKAAAEVGNDVEKEEEIVKIKKNGKVIKRVLCTVDPSHTVWSDKLNKHVRTCNATKKIQKLEEQQNSCIWFERDVNIKECKKSEGENSAKPQEIQNEKSDLERKEALDVFLADFLVAYDKFFKEEASELPLSVSNFKFGLEERFDELTNQKHIIQQSSLIGQLNVNNLFDPKYSYVEFGCGRAELSRYLNRALIDKQINTGKTNEQVEFLLIDRASPSMKFDTKLGKDYNEIKTKSDNKDLNKPPKVERLKVDIKDLVLDKAFVNGNFEKPNYVGISKHLCGVATDLTLRCIMNSLNKDECEFEGLLVAMCCRHCCDYDILMEASKDYLKENFGIDKQKFTNYIQRLVSWATNGLRPGFSKEQGSDSHYSGLSYEEREKIGLKARRVIDESRKHAMLREGYSCELKKYVNSEISLENTCLIIKRAD